MAATALIQLTQGVTVGVAGQALFGAAGAAVDVANDSNTGVASWQIELVDVPPASALTTGIKASSDNGSTPAYSFTPDVAGGYRLVLKVWGAINRSGTATDTDIRNFGVLGAGGLYRPSAQLWPRALPPAGSGETGNKPDENNFGGQTRGWAGDGSDGLLAETIGRVDAVTASGTALMTAANLGAQYALLSPALYAQGILAETAPPVTQGVIASGTVYFMGVQLFAGQTVSRISIGISTAGNGTNLSKVGLYSAAGVRLALSADQGNSWDTAGVKNIAMIAPYAVTTSGWYYVAWVSTSATTLAIPVVSIATSSVVLGAIGPYNGGSTLRWGVQTGQADLPSPATIVAGVAPKVIWAVVGGT